MSSSTRVAGARRREVGGAAATLFVTGVCFIGVATATQQAPPPEVPLASTADGAPPAPAPAAAPTPSAPAARPAPPGSSPAPVTAPVTAPTATPVRVRVPAIDVSSDLLHLALDPEGALEVPEDPDLAGWFAGGTAPGDPGAAVLAGHVDSMDGPAVFYLLSALEPGASVLVDREDGTTAVFRVYRVARYPKDALPTAEIYAAAGPELRLVTCGGTFDESLGHYRDNVVAYASLVEVR